MAALPVPPFTIRQALAACGVNDNDLFEGETPAQRLSFDLFDDSFESCKDKSDHEIDSDFKSYSTLTQAQGQI